MTTYLTIITTALVVTQIIRLIQNAIQLHRHTKLIESEDYEMQKRAYKLIVEKLEKEKEND